MLLESARYFFSSLPYSPLIITPLWWGPSSCLGLGNLRATLSSVGVLSQSCPEVAWVVCVALRSRVSCTFTGGPIYSGYISLLPSGCVFDRSFSEFVQFFRGCEISDIFQSLDVKHFCELKFALEKDLACGVFQTLV